MRAPVLVSLSLCLTVACDEGYGVDEEASHFSKPWHEVVAESVDHDVLQGALGSLLPARSGVFAVRVLPPLTTLGTPRYRFYSAHGWSVPGGHEAIFESSFSTASTAKLIAAIGAFEYASREGYDSDDIPLYAWEARTAGAKSIDTLAMEALTYCEGLCNNAANPAFDRLVGFAGLDYVPRKLLTTERGFYRELDGRYVQGALQYRMGVSGTYAADETFQIWDSTSTTMNSVCSSAHAGQCETLRTDCSGYDPVDCADGDDFEYIDNCPYGPGNCVSLFDLSEAMRRAVLGNELPSKLRLEMPEPERMRLAEHLAAYRYPYANEGALAAGPAQTVWHKFGSNQNACVETMFVEYSPEERYAVALWTNQGNFGDCAQLIRTVVEKSILTMRADATAPIVQYNPPAGGQYGGPR